jgi:lipoprotein-anchoring transpeptidase ErfK/SrfK
MTTSIRVSLGKRQLTLLENGKPIRTYPVGVGKIATKTPTGTYKIVNRAANPERRPGGPRSVYGDYWLGLSRKGYGIHGTNNESSIGKYVSHGCIRMHNRDVLDLAKRVDIGTVVQIVP